MGKHPISINNYYYSPLVFSLIMLFMIYMGLALAENPNKPFIAGWAWLSGVPMLLLGSVLQIFSKRVLFIKVFQTLLMLQMSVVFAFTLWSIERQNQPDVLNWRTVVIVGSVSICCFVSGYLSSATRLKKTRMPHGAIGVLNFSTGMVDSKQDPKELQVEKEKTENVARWILQWGPLFVGLLMALTRVFGSQNQEIGVVISSLVFLVFGTLGFGGNVFDIKAILNWEAKNKKHIYVK